MAIMKDIQNSQVVRAYRQGWLAWLGAHKTAFDFAQDGVSKLMNSREELVEDLVQKGEEVEGLAQDNIEKVRGYVEPRFSDVTERFNEVSEKVTGVRNKVMDRVSGESTDRVVELSAEVAKLTKTVNALSRKVNTAAKPAAKKPVAKKTVAKKVAKPAVKKAAPVAKKAAPAKAAAPKAAPAAAPKAADDKAAA